LESHGQVLISTPTSSILAIVGHQCFIFNVGLDRPAYELIHLGGDDCGVVFCRKSVVELALNTTVITIIIPSHAQVVTYL
jgi:hypothetical protein